MTPDPGVPASQRDPGHHLSRRDLAVDGPSRSAHGLHCRLGSGANRPPPQHAAGPMITEDQTPVIELLAAPSTHGGAPVERIETHASIVFLAGTRAWKLKRAVCYDYLDFSSARHRKALCEAEVCLNRRTAPALYSGVVAIVRRSDGALALGGPGVPVDWVVEMNRFDQDALFDRLAGRDALDTRAHGPSCDGNRELSSVRDTPDGSWRRRRRGVGRRR